MVAMATSMAKIYTCQKIWFENQIIILWCFETDTKTFIYSQNLEDIFRVIHQCIRGGIP